MSGMCENKTYDVIVVGGGAAGLAAAISAAWAARGGVAAHGEVPGGEVTDGEVTADDAAFARNVAPARLNVAVFEADERVGRSILATGNGRCNFSNAYISPEVYRNAPFVSEVFAALERVAPWGQGGATGSATSGENGSENASATGGEASGENGGANASATSGEKSGENGSATSGEASGENGSANASATGGENGSQKNAVLAFFSWLGLMWREEAQGRLFPVTGKASTVLDVLRAAVRALGVQECCNTRVQSIEPPRAPGKPYTLRLADGAFARAQAVVCAVGGAVARQLLPDDLAYTAPVPVLGPLRTETSDIRGLDNIRVRCNVSLERDKAVIARESGEVLFRKYGLSGIAIFNVSRHAQPGDVVALDLFPALSENQLVEHLFERARAFAAVSGRAATCEDVLRGMVLPLVAEALCKVFGLKLEDEATPDAIHRIACLAKRFKVKVQGVGDAKQCQVHRGGFACEGFEAQTLECREYAGLFAAGEMLDVDAPCGGYNLHWAWSSGMLAGMYAAETCRAKAGE